MVQSRLLIVLANSPLPMRSGSAIVAYKTMRELKARFLIDLICPKPALDSSELEAVAHVAEYVRHASVSWFGRWWSHLWRLVRFEPPLSGEADFDAMQEAVREKLRIARYDAVLLFEVSALKYCPPDAMHKVIVQMEDPQSIKFRRMSDLPVLSLVQKLKWKILARLMHHYEAKVLPSLGRVLLLSEADVRDMRGETVLSNLVHVPYGVELPEIPEISDHSMREQAIVYSGNMFHPPNVDGGLFFLKQIFPLILRAMPEVKLWIVGADPDARLVRATKEYGQSVVLTGRVDDVSTYIRRAAVSICPVRLKIGVQTKVLEALAWATPVVTTSAGNSGVGGVSGRHLWVADDPRDFARRTCDLLSGKGWNDMARDGRDFVANGFAWSRSARLLEEQLDALIGGRS